MNRAVDVNTIDLKLIFYFLFLIHYLVITAKVCYKLKQEIYQNKNLLIKQLLIEI